MSAPTPAPERRRLTPRRLARIAAALVAAAGVALLALVPLQYWAFASAGFDNVCTASVARVPADEGTLLAGAWSWWPLGTSCRWTLLDGTVVESLPDWSATAVAIVGAAMLVVGVVAVILLRRRAR